MKSEIQLSDSAGITVCFDYKTFDVIAPEFTLKDLDIIKQQKIGNYGIDELRFMDSNSKLRYKLKKKERKVYALDNNKDVVFEGNLIFNKQSEKVLERIEIIKNTTSSNIAEAWIALATMNKLYGSQNKDVLRMILKGVVFGATVGAIEAVIK